MKKLFIGLLIFILLVIALVFGLLFTGPGNSILKPIIEAQASKALKMDVEIGKLALRVGSLDIEATVQKNIKAKVVGPLSLFSRTLDLDYSINADNIPEIEGIKIEGSAQLSGKVVGSFSDLSAAGKGEIFGANINFDTKLVNYKPASIVADVSKLSLSKTLALLNQPIYSEGIISLKADIVPNDKNELSGKAVANLENGTIYEKVILKEFGIELPKNTRYVVDANFNVADSNDLIGKINVISSLATLKTTNTTYDIKNANAKSDFVLNVEDLSKLSSIAKMPLQGQAKLYGKASYGLNNMQANVLSDNLLGGKLNLVFDNDKANITLAGVKIEEVLKTLVKPIYSVGKVDLTANLQSIKSKKGDASFVVTDGLLSSGAISKDFNITLPLKTQYNAGANILIDGDKLKFATKVFSTLLNVDKFNGTFDTNKTKLESEFIVVADDLSKFNTITNKTMKGSLGLDGFANYSNDVLHVKALSNNFANGKLSVELNGDKLVATIDKAKAAQILAMAGQPQYIDGETTLKVDLLSLEKKKGDIVLSIINGNVNSAVIKKEFDQELPPTTYSANANINLNDGKALFDSKLHSSLANIKKLDGSYDIDKAALDSKYSIDVPDLSKLDTITKQKMKGKIELNGAAKLTKGVLHVDGKTKIAGGDLNFDFNDGKLVAKGKELSTNEILNMMSYPDIFVAKVDANFNYDTKKQLGSFNATSPSGQLKDNTLVHLVEPILKVDMTQERYKTVVIGNMNNELINFNMDMTSNMTYLRVTNGRMNAGVLDMPIALKIKNRDLGAHVKGKPDNLKVSIDSSQYLMDKIGSELNSEKTQKKILKFLDKL